MKGKVSAIVLVIIFAAICGISLLNQKQKTENKISVVSSAKSEYEIEKEMKAKITADYLDNIERTLIEPHFEYIDSIRHICPDDLEEIANKVKVEKNYDGLSAYVSLNPWIYGKPKIAKAKKGIYICWMHAWITEKNIDNPFDVFNQELEIYEHDTHTFIYSKGKDVEKRNVEYKQWERCQNKEKSNSKHQSESKESNSNYSYNDKTSTISNGRIKTGKDVSINATCIGAIDEATLVKISDFASKGDEGAMKVAVASGYAIVIQRGTTATIVSIRTGKVRVRLSDGRMVWVLYKHVK